jgi:riboflavin kinase/FMN adenylyltransferase
MRELTSLPELAQLPGPVSLAIGVFDGLHLGHREVISCAVRSAVQRGGSSVVMTFEPHPLAVLRPGFKPVRLCGRQQRSALLAEWGVDALLICPFTPELAATSAEEFLQQLCNSCRPLGSISVGAGWSFGHQRRGDSQVLSQWSRDRGFVLNEVPALTQDNQPISSTRIRQAIADGNFEVAARLLGRRVEWIGQVVQGRQLGRQLGFATANLALENEVLPPRGVYVARLRWQGQVLAAVANLGLRPSVEGGDAAPTLEVHVLDWQGNLYGQWVEVELCQRLRQEIRFDGLEPLRAAIASDVQAARDWHASKPA